MTKKNLIEKNKSCVKRYTQKNENRLIKKAQKMLQ